MGDIYLDGRLIGTDAIVLIHGGMSYVEIGTAIHKALSLDGEAIVLDIESGPCGEIELPGRPDLLDMILAEMPAKKQRVVPARPSYLQHDPTKRAHRRPR